MWLASMRCPKCGLIQRQNPTCKACGARVGDQAPSARAPSTLRPVRTDAAAMPTVATPPQIQQQTSAAEPGEDAARRFSFNGTLSSLFGIQVINMLLTLVTVGIYSFWSKVKVRKYLMSQTEFEGDRFAYHGTGKELLVGSLKAGLVFGAPIAALNLLPALLGGRIAIQIITALLIFSLVSIFIPFAIVASRRYRLSRTSWRGVRFSFRGRVVDFIKLFLKGSVLTTITLGLYYPFFDTQRYRFMISNSYFGNRKFDFDGHGRDLFPSYLIAMVLSVITLGIYWFWFQAKKQRYFVDHTSFATARLRSTITGGALMRLVIGNLLLLSVPLMLAMLGAGGVLLLVAPGAGLWESMMVLAARGKELWLVVGAAALGWLVGWFLALSGILLRNIRVILAYLSIEGPLNLLAIQQEAQAASATGEALAGFLDMDFGIG